MTFDDALALLFRAPHADFVTERKRLAAELKASGDKDGAAKLGKLARPPISAWAVNQLWWQARAEFEALLATARKVREGDFAATGAHKAALAALRSRAVELLAGAGNAAAEATVRKVETSLSAIAANGGFAPDADGALMEDRDPPGFASLGIVTGGAVVAPAAGGAAEAAVQAQVEEATRALAAAAAKAQAEIDAQTRAVAVARAEAERKQALILEEARRRPGARLSVVPALPEEESDAASASASGDGAGADVAADGDSDADAASASDAAAARVAPSTTRAGERAVVEAQIKQWKERVAFLLAELASARASLAAAESRLDHLE
jgi:hypothetical protein